MIYMLKINIKFFLMLISDGHSKSVVEKINHCKRLKQVHTFSKDQLQVQEQVNEIIC